MARSSINRACRILPKHSFGDLEPSHVAGGAPTSGSTGFNGGRKGGRPPGDPLDISVEAQIVGSQLEIHLIRNQ